MKSSLKNFGTKCFYPIFALQNKNSEIKSEITSFEFVAQLVAHPDLNRDGTGK